MLNTYYLSILFTIFEVIKIRDMTAFDKFKLDFHTLFGKNKQDVITPSTIRTLKTDNIDGRKWNDFKHINK